MSLLQPLAGLLLAATVTTPVPAPVPAPDTPVEHIVHDDSNYEGGVTVASFDARVEGHAKGTLVRYPEGALRGVEYDIVFPRNYSEYVAFGKYAILLLSASTRDAAELPIADAYVQGTTGPVEFHRIGGTARQNAPETAMAQAYGAFREDAFFLVPIADLYKDSLIYCDFKANRLGFSVNKGALDMPDYVRWDAHRSVGKLPTAEQVRKILDREYPGFHPE
jgi:hypothetical protein